MNQLIKNAFVVSKNIKQRKILLCNKSIFKLRNYEGICSIAGGYAALFTGSAFCWLLQLIYKYPSSYEMGLTTIYN